MTKTRVTTFLVGLSLIATAWVGLSGVGGPTLLHPLPALTVIPLFFLPLHQLFFLVLILPAMFFFAWNPSLFQGNAKVPRRSYILFALAVGLSVPWFVLGWKFGLQYQGADYVRRVCGLNALWITAVGLTFLLSWKRSPNFGASLVLHWVLFAWLSWYAFPYLGELL
jgi:hypothetical protein